LDDLWPQNTSNIIACKFQLNSGVAGVGGFLKPKGNCKITYARGLGESTNNQAEALALYQGLNILKSKKIQSRIVSGDSCVTIQQM
jgi:ribonuclease HI